MQELFCEFRKMFESIFPVELLLTLNVPIPDKVKKLSQIKAFKAFIKPFEAPQRSAEIKI